MIVYASWRCFAEAAFASLSRKAMTISLELLKKWSFQIELSFSPSTGGQAKAIYLPILLGGQGKATLFLAKSVTTSNTFLQISYQNIFFTRTLSFRETIFVNYWFEQILKFSCKYRCGKEQFCGECLLLKMLAYWPFYEYLLGLLPSISYTMTKVIYRVCFCWYRPCIPYCMGHKMLAF